MLMLFRFVHKARSSIQSPVSTWRFSTPVRLVYSSPTSLGAHPPLPRTEITRKRNPEEIKAAFEEFKLRFHNFLEQLSQDQRSARKRKRIHAYLTQVFGHHNGMWDYLLTGEMPPLYLMVTYPPCMSGFWKHTARSDGRNAWRSEHARGAVMAERGGGERHSERRSSHPSY